MRRALSGVSLVLAASLLGACGEGAPPSVAEVGDTLVVHSSTPERDTATLREVVRIGRLDGPDEYLFAAISMFAVGPSGEVYVAEPEGDLRKFDGSGDFLGTVARPGEGPGEVQYVVGMDIADDGRLAVVDFGNQRVSVYSPEGELLRQVRRPAGRPRYGRDAIRWDADGELWVGLHPPRRGPDTLGAGPRPLYGRLTGDGEVRDTLFLPRRSWEGCETRTPAYAGGYYEDRRLPFYPFVHWPRGEGGTVAFGCAADYSFVVVRPDGQVVRVSRAWEPPVMSPAEHRFHLEWMGRVPEERPAFLRLWLDGEGRVWAWPGAPGESRETSPELQERGAPPVAWDWSSPTDGFDVFGSDGRWLGHVATPRRWASSPYPGNGDPQFRGDTVWGVTEDELGVAHVSKFVIEWPESTGAPSN